MMQQHPWLQHSKRNSRVTAQKKYLFLLGDHIILFILYPSIKNVVLSSTVYDLGPWRTIAAAIHPILWIRVICIIFLLANNSSNETDNDLSDWTDLFLALENIENFCLSGSSSDDVESIVSNSDLVLSSPFSKSKRFNKWNDRREILILSSIPGKDWFDDEFDFEKKWLIVAETLRRPWWGRIRTFCNLSRSVFSADPFAPSHSLDSGRKAIKIKSKASLTPMTSVKYLKK